MTIESDTPAPIDNLKREPTHQKKTVTFITFRKPLWMIRYLTDCVIKRFLKSVCGTSIVFSVPAK